MKHEISTSQKKIIDFLNKQKESVPMTKIIRLAKVDYYQCQDDLEELLGQNKVIQVKFNRKTYWRVVK